MKIVECNTKEEGEVIVNGINRHNDSKIDRVLSFIHKDIRLVAKNEKNKIVGGIFGSIGYYAGFKISILWVHEDFRDKGIGGKLLKEGEIKAKELGATLAMLDTFSFQAEAFYIKKGYEVFGKINEFPKNNEKLIFFKKQL